MKFNKKKWTWIFALLLVVSWSSVQAVNHYVYVKGQDAVDDDKKEIRFTFHFDYDFGYYWDFLNAQYKWNSYSNAVKIIPSYESERTLNVFDFSNSADKVYGRYTHYWFWWQTDTLRLNDYWIKKRKLNNKARQKLIMHELGHSLGLDHSYAGNVMDVGSIQHNYLGNQDKIDYDYLWD